jgi:hypothetical protein
MSNQHYILKPESVGPPTQYLFAQVGQFGLPNDPTSRRWYLSSEKYVKEATCNVQDWLKCKGVVFKTKASGVMSSGYRPELDVS